MSQRAATGRAGPVGMQRGGTQGSPLGMICWESRRRCCRLHAVLGYNETRGALWPHVGAPDNGPRSRAGVAHSTAPETWAMHGAAICKCTVLQLAVR